MSEIFCNKLAMQTSGDLPHIGKKAPNFELTSTDMDTITLDTFKGCSLLINVYPSLDTSVCFNSVNVFSKELAGQDTYLLCVSMDLPFALKRIAQGEQLESIHLLSAFKSPEFGQDYGVTISNGPFKNLLTRAVFVLDTTHKLVYAELVKDIANPPDYKKAIAAIKADDML